MMEQSSERATLDGRTAIVSGAARGVGLATARLLGDAGASLILIDADGDELAVVADLLGKTNRVLAMPIDVSSSADVRDAVTGGASALGGVDILVNNTAIQSPSGTVVDATDEDWQRYLAVNAVAPGFLARETIPIIRERGGGSIVNIASISGFAPFPSQAVYAASKGAMIQLTRSIAVDFGNVAIRANCICPGPILSGPVLAGRSPAEAMKLPALVQLAARHPLRRLAEPLDIAHAVLFLAGPHARHITGATLVVDGGLTVPGSTLDG